MDELIWTYNSFEELTTLELYSILQLRSEVFVVEQNCVYHDIDNKDKHCFHLCGWLKDELVAYARIIPPGVTFSEASIGRLCTSPAYRSKKSGRLLMIKAIELTKKQFGVSIIRIGAQTYLNKFYASLGFQNEGSGYIEDGIPHIEMLLSR